MKTGRQIVFRKPSNDFLHKSVEIDEEDYWVTFLRDSIILGVSDRFMKSYINVEKRAKNIGHYWKNDKINKIYKLLKKTEDKETIFIAIKMLHNICDFKVKENNEFIKESI